MLPIPQVGYGAERLQPLNAYKWPLTALAVGADNRIQTVQFRAAGEAQLVERLHSSELYELI
ncbi:hypothetical protein H6F93_00620 [Leptolyngbya sp. FACHB-671]|uniref:hypothetical protein n=1 Tax=Leptolyngbya sp. FACHB-671 TaxID=2692812 RepID=UPI001687EEF5|nr:hypothetical protein [Leptolyngbya sp. FACHB-671]MBD2066054.1 hypothetical protein [Leptolyngbya sp. FACHB-671]